MADNETQSLQESPLDLSVLRIDTATDAGDSHRKNSSPCFSCGGTGYSTTPSNTMKRSSPEPVTESKPKNVVLDRNHPLFGFSKIPLSSPLTQSFPTLRRCASDPYHSPGTAIQSPTGNANIVGESQGSPSASALPPKAPVLRRSASDPYHSPGTTFREGSPSAKRLKRMEDRMREMSRWLHDAMSEDENLVSTEDATKDECETEYDDVTVERKGDRVVVCFRCLCGRGYKILLLGEECYYKLM